MSSMIIHKICNHIEALFSKRRINLILTVWINFRCLPFLQAIRFPIFVYGRPIIYNSRCKIIIESAIKRGMIKFNYQRIWAPSLMNQQSEFNCNGTIVFKGGGYIGTGTKICVSKNAVLKIGNNFKITDFVNIGCYNYIMIGNNCRITHRCQIFDTNYHYIANMKLKQVKCKTMTVKIGNSCWICNSSTISPGTILPDYTIVGSNSLVNRDYSSILQYSLIAGIPAKFICSDVLRVENSIYEKKIDKHYENSDDYFCIPTDWNVDGISTII